MAKKTALYDTHVALGGKIVDFAGYALPVQYRGILVEHKAVRTAAGIFDEACEDVFGLATHKR